MVLIAGTFALAAGGPALAADLPQPGPPPPRAPATYVPVVAPVYNWSGIYVGINGGYGFGDSNWSTPGLARRAISAPPASSPAARSVAITSGASSCWASRAMSTGRTSRARPSSPLVLGAALVAKPRVIGSQRSAAASAMRLTASWSMGRAAPPSAIVQAACRRACPSAARRKMAGPPAPASNSPSRRT